MAEKLEHVTDEDGNVYAVRNSDGVVVELMGASPSEISDVRGPGDEWPVGDRGQVRPRATKDDDPNEVKGPDPELWGER